MNKVALKMLFGDPLKCLGLIFGVAFSSLLIMQQSSVFVGIMRRTSSVILDAQDVNVWVMDPSVQYVDANRPLRETELSRVRGVEGVAWAVPFFKTNSGVRSRSGNLQNAQIIGVDSATFIGAPRKMVMGSIEDLRKPDAVMIDRTGYKLLFPDKPLQLGEDFEINDRRAVVAAIVENSAAFTANISIYAPYSRAVSFTNPGRTMLSFVVARAQEGLSPEAVARAIERETRLKARSSDEFRWDTFNYILANTGIPISFGAVVSLGVIVGVVVAGLTFNMFVAENIRQFAALKAIGVTNLTILRMVLVQAGVVGAIGYSLGLGIVARFFDTVPKIATGLRGFYLPWQIALGMAILTVIIMLVASSLSLRRVMTVDPAVVFRG